MTTNTQAPDAAPKKLMHPIIAIVLVILVAVGVVLVFAANYLVFVDNTHASQADSMQKSLEAHGFKADSALAQRVSDGCRYQQDHYPISTTIVHDYNGKKSAITFMCDGNASISDFAAIPVP